jgi:hypothetical protein
MRRIIWGFCRNWFLMSPLHYLSGRSDFGFEFGEIYIFKNWLPAITDTESGGATTPRITDTRSPHHRYGESAIEFLKRKLSVSIIRRVVDTLHQWYGESPTPRIVESESHWLHVSQIRRVDDSAYSLVGESTTPRIGDTGSRYLKKKLVYLRFSVL